LLSVGQLRQKLLHYRGECIINECTADDGTPIYDCTYSLTYYWWNLWWWVSRQRLLSQF
jgi:hypothetical protein